MTGPLVDHYDVAIILGAQLAADGQPSPAMRRRVARGVALLQEGAVGALVMTGGATTCDRPEAQVMAALAAELGAPAASVMTEEQSRNTIENALFTAPLVRQHGWRRVLVVTDSFHRLRADYIFRRFGLPVTLMGVRPARPTRRWWLAHGREAAALPWTILRVEIRRRIEIRRLRRCGCD